MYRIDFSRLRFLIVDDNVHMRRILLTILHGFGARDVGEAEDGAEGLERFNKQAPDILLTDWSMPIFNGVELTRMVRQASSSVNPYIPVIMISAYAERQHVTEARDAGVTEFLVKPISAKSLYQRIFSVVATPRPFIKTASYFGPDRRRTMNSQYHGPDRRADHAAGEHDDILNNEDSALDRLGPAEI